MYPITIKIKTLTPIWTGGVNRKCDRLHETGILGSLRWWYEAIVRGLGGYACDPTDESIKCKEYDLKRGPKSVCAACYLFGCTGWARKFRFEIRGDNSNKLGALVQQRIRANQTLWLVFRPIRPVNLEEITLLWKTVQLIAKYGAMGGRTAFKPSEIAKKNRRKHHQDFGLLAMQSTVPTALSTKPQIERYVRRFRPCGNGDGEWQNLENFWFVSKALTRDKHNEIVGRDNMGRIAASTDIFLSGFTSMEKGRFTKHQKQQTKEQNAASKKIFSFHTNDWERTFGYTKEGQLDHVIKCVVAKTGWDDSLFKRGGEVIDELFR